MFKRDERLFSSLFLSRRDLKAVRSSSWKMQRKMPVKARTQQVNKEMLQTQTLVILTQAFNITMLLRYMRILSGRKGSYIKNGGYECSGGGCQSQDKVRNTRFHDGKSDVTRRCHADKIETSAVRR